jgi:hypothetical protein
MTRWSVIVSKPQQERASTDALEALSAAELECVTGGDGVPTVLINPDMGQPRGPGGPPGPGPGG